MRFCQPVRSATANCWGTDMTPQQIRIERLKLLPGKVWTSQTVIEWLQEAEADPGPCVPVRSKSGPGNAGWPCECGKGSLVMRAAQGYVEGSGYIRRRACKACGAVWVTTETLTRPPGKHGKEPGESYRGPRRNGGAV